MMNFMSVKLKSIQLNNLIFSKFKSNTNPISFKLNLKEYLFSSVFQF